LQRVLLRAPGLVSEDQLSHANTERTAELF